MNQCPVTANLVWKKCRVLVVRREDHTVPLEAAEVLRKSKRDARTAARIRGVHNGVLLQLRHIGQAGIFDTPEFFRVLLYIRHQGWRGIDLPAVHTIGGTCRTEMRQAAAVFHATEEKGRF